MTRLRSSALPVLLLLPALLDLPLGGGPEQPIHYVPIDGSGGRDHLRRVRDAQPDVRCSTARSSRR